MRAHARRRLKCRIRDRGRLRFRGRVPVQGRVRVRVRSQEVPGAEPTAGQWSPQRGELRAQGTVLVAIPLWLPRPHMLFLPCSRRPPESFRAAAAGLGNDMVSLQFPCRVSLHRFRIPGTWFCQTLELGPHEERALAMVRIRSRDVTRAEATPVSWSPLRAEVRVHARRRLKCRNRDRGRLRFRWGVPVQGRVRVRVRSQEVLGAEPTAGQWSPQRAKLRAQGMVPVRIPLWLPRPHMLFVSWSRRPPESFRAAVAVPGK